MANLSNSGTMLIVGTEGFSSARDILVRQTKLTNSVGASDLNYFEIRANQWQHEIQAVVEDGQIVVCSPNADHCASFLRKGHDAGGSKQATGHPAIHVVKTLSHRIRHRERYSPKIIHDLCSVFFTTQEKLLANPSPMKSLEGELKPSRRYTNFSINLGKYQQLLSSLTKLAPKSFLSALLSLTCCNSSRFRAGRVRRNTKLPNGESRSSGNAYSNPGNRQSHSRKTSRRPSTPYCPSVPPDLTATTQRPALADSFQHAHFRIPLWLSADFATEHGHA